MNSNGFISSSRCGIFVDVDVEADAAAARHLAALEVVRPAAPQVAEADEQLVVEQLEARLDEQLLLERVAHLDGRALVLGPLVELLAREHARAADAVAAGGRADEQHEVARAGRHRAREVLLAHEADRHRVDEAVALVGLLEVDLAADGRHAEAVAVAADAGDRALEQVALARLVERAEAQRVERGDRTRAHREDVADDAADAGRRALVGLDRAGVVVRLHLEGDRPAVAHADDARVLAGALQHVRARRSGTCRSALRECL